MTTSVDDVSHVRATLISNAEWRTYRVNVLPTNMLCQAEIAP